MIRILFHAGTGGGTGNYETAAEGFSGTLAELIKHLEERGKISAGGTSNGDPTDDLIFMINGQPAAGLGGLGAVVSDGDEVSVFPMVGGG